ncbi:MAG: POTRA domain-containing protein [Bryobacteraceae bacterium]
MRTVIALALAGTLIATGQTSRARKPVPAPKPAAVAKPAEFPLESLKITGNKVFTDAQIIAASGLKIGAPANKQVFDQARDRLAVTGAFLDIRMAYSPSPSNVGYAGVIDVEEASEVYPVRFEDLPVPAATLRAHMKAIDPLYTERIPGTKEFLARWSAELDKTVKKLVPNWTDTVTARLTADLDILFRPSTSRPSVAEIRFVGNSVLPTSQLQNAMNAVAIGIVYSEPTLRTMLENSIKPLYDARGRIRVSFPKIEFERHQSSDGVVPVITVNEGPSYAISGVQLTGTGKPVKKLLEKFDIKPGDIANFDRIKEGQIRIEDEFRSEGYLNVKSKAERVIDDEKHTVGVTVVLQPAAQYLFGKLTIKGLDILVEPQIRKAWNLASGKPFNPEYPDKFIKYLKDEGVFENLADTTRAEKDVDDKAHVVDVTLYFKGAPSEKKKIPSRPEPEPPRPVQP